ncbi:dihydrofolate reductase family protein [Danxiaibacter flavus]|uniref:Dihydrofolate reductase family protein n=1 Tax=Danxiaibacter flavus TaxID=3049108 RepID=A0ABV3ZLD8_9BACT|nr:dihydrofolate reductase family protein [Chitinophagaceae bacterium DXS]
MGYDVHITRQEQAEKKENMKKVIAAINMTLDGFCDHTSGVPDEEVHQHYADLLRGADAILYGRITYQLMEFWQTVLQNPTGDKAMDDFAVAIDKTPKIIFSRTLKSVDWKSAKLASQDLEKEVLELKQSLNDGSKAVFVGSPSLIVALTKLNLIDEYQLCVHPVIAGSGLPLFKNISEKITLKLIKTKTFGGGAVILYYEPANETTTNR